MLLLLDSSLCGCWIQACGVATERRCNSDFDDLQVGIAKVGVLPCLPARPPARPPACPIVLCCSAHASCYAACLAVFAFLLPQMDMGASRVSVWKPGCRRFALEPQFVPRPGATSEDDGWLLAMLFDSGGPGPAWTLVGWLGWWRLPGWPCSSTRVGPERFGLRCYLGCL